MPEPMATYTLSADYGSVTIRPQRCDTLYRVLLRHPARLIQPLRWKRQRMIPE